MPKVLDDRTASVVDALCEAIVPGSTRVGPGVYVDAVLARMGEADRAASLAAINTLADEWRKARKHSPSAH